MRTTLLLLLLLATAASHAHAKPKNRFTRYPSWNTKMFPIWKDGDPRYTDSWKGGRVTFNVGNDSPTLSGASVTFTIDLEFPQNQKVQTNGDVVWAEDCVVNGTKHRESEPVYPAQNTDWEAVFPDGTPLRRDKKPNYVFVWKAWGQYWQVADDSSSTLTIQTDHVPLGSYSMDVVIYHYRSKEKFIPLGYASTQFSITDQVPFSVSLDQVNDIMAGDLRFVQNRAIAFTVTLHDPSRYLSDADITFNWDFGDESGALISRELTVTHTYVSAGSFKPHVVVQAVVPDKTCSPPSGPTTQAPDPPANRGTTVKAPLLVSAGPVLVSTKASGLSVNVVPLDSEEDEASTTASMVQPGQETPTEDKNPSLDGEAENELRSTEAEPGPGPGPDVKGTLMLTGRATVVLAKREAADKQQYADDCVIYRYGSFCTNIEVVKGIERVEITEMDDNVMETAGTDRRALDLTVTCQGSLPKEVCSVILDAECLRPIHTVCNMVEPSRECQLVLRHFFNNSGVYCINVSMANDVSLAATSAKVNIDMDSGLSSPASIAMVLGVLVLVLAVGVAAYSYKHLKSYRPLKDDLVVPAAPKTFCSGSSTFWNLLNRRGAVDNCPLLQDRPV